MHPHTAQTPRGAGLQRGRPPVPQFPADAALAPADELLFEEIADVVVIDDPVRSDTMPASVISRRQLPLKLIAKH